MRLPANRVAQLLNDRKEVMTQIAELNTRELRTVYVAGWPRDGGGVAFVWRDTESRVRAAIRQLGRRKAATATITPVEVPADLKDEAVTRFLQYRPLATIPTGPDAVQRGVLQRITRGLRRARPTRS